MNLKECVEAYGLNQWLAETKDPTVKLIKPKWILVDNDEEFICYCDHKDSVEPIVVRMKVSNPSHKFIKFGAQ